MGGMFSKLTIETPDRRQCFLMSHVIKVIPIFVFVNFEQITHLVLDFSLLTVSC